MELVHGIPITDFCDKAKLATHQRLELFIQVCRAVQHAHQKGIIHRDLKPSNILVTLIDGRAVPKVIDFGIAKATSGQLSDETVVTHFAQMIGTPLYMSPEQAESSSQDIDTRSDVYSLGVLLYELLTGTTPFERERLKEVGFDEFRRIIREEEPPRPSTRLSTLDAALDTTAEKHQTDPRKLSRLVSGELDWIVMKALEKDRTRRYESANELAKDVQRYLDDEPVEACPPTVGYRLGKFARRNRAALVTITAVTLALIIGLAGTTWQAFVATEARNLAKQRLADVDEQRKLAEANLGLADEQRKLAEKNFQMAFDAVHQMLSEVGGDRLADVPRAEPLRKALLEKALAFYEDFLAEQGDDPKVQIEAAKARRRAGYILKLLGEYQRAEKHYREEVSIYERLYSNSPDEHGYAHKMLLGITSLAGLLRETSQHDKARLVTNQGRRIAKELAVQAPGNKDYRRARLDFLLESAMLLLRLGQLEEAENACREALEIAEPLAAEFSKSREYRYAPNKCRICLANILRERGQVKEAADAYRRAVPVFEQLVDEFPNEAYLRDKLAVIHSNLDVLLREVGDIKEAESHRREAMKLRKQLVADYPAVPKYRAALAGSHGNMASVLATTGRHDESEAAYREARAIWKQLSKDFPEMPSYASQVARFNGVLAIHLANTGRSDEAEAFFVEANKIMERVVAEFPEIPTYRNSLATNQACWGEFLVSSGRTKEAEPLIRQAVKIQESLVVTSPDVPEYRGQLAAFHGVLGKLLRDLDRTGEAEQARRKSLCIKEQLAKDCPDMPQRQYSLAVAHHNLGLLLVETDRADEAARSYGKAVQVLEPLAATFPKNVEYREGLREVKQHLDELNNAGSLPHPKTESPEGGDSQLPGARASGNKANQPDTANDLTP